MRLEKASNKAIKYACMSFHYAKSVPVNPFAFSVFNDAKEWCGCILYSAGANPNIGSQYGLQNGQIIELVRMALNGKQNSTSKALALSLKLIKSKMPTVKMIVSYADLDQEHTGIIYQATNWFYVGLQKPTGRAAFIINGKKVHPKTLHSRGIIQSIKEVQKYYPDATEFFSQGKHKYIYPLDKSLIPLCKSLSKPYPKAQEVNQDKCDASSIEIGGSNPTLALTKQKQIAAV
jgi:hypothetical protein